MLIQKFTQKPPTIEAIRFTEFNTADILRWLKDSSYSPRAVGDQEGKYEPTISSQSIKGTNTAHLGDYIVKLSDGSFEVWAEEKMAGYELVKEVSNG